MPAAILPESHAYPTLSPISVTLTNTLAQEPHEDTPVVPGKAQSTGVLRAAVAVTVWKPMI
jgi:hypothetical protein